MNQFDKDINVINQQIKFTYQNNGVLVEYSLKATDDSDPYAVIDAIDRLTFAIAAIGATDISTTKTVSPSQPVKQTYKGKCDDCGNIAITPFKPKDNKPLYCNECYKKHNYKDNLGY